MNQDIVTGEQLIAQLRWRYATKKFDAKKKIPSDTWRALEETLVLAPSSFGLQLWKFFVVDKPAVRQQLLAASWDQSQIVDASHLVVFAQKTSPGKAEIERWVKRIAEVRQIPVATLKGYSDMMEGFILSRPGFNVDEWAARQVYIALGVFLSSAALLGIDACPMEGVDPAAYNKILGLENTGYTTLMVATAGYRSSEDAAAKDKKARYDSSEVIAHI